MDVDGWMDGCGWMDGWMDGWIDMVGLGLRGWELCWGLVGIDWVWGL